MQKYTPYKKSADYSYTLGIFPTLELLKARPHIVEAVFTAPNTKDSQGLEKIKQLCAQHHVPCTEDVKTLKRLSKADNCYAIAVFKKFDSALSSDTSHVVLVNPDDAGNLGTIMRTMLGFDCHDLAIISPAADSFDPKTIRASMGAVFAVRVAYFTSIDAYQEKFGHHLYPFLLNTENSLANTIFIEPYSLVFGNEGSGLPNIYKTLGTPVKIEQSTEIDSLNLAVSVAVALYKSYTRD
jgi:TrmH family RNA methyltransferase